MGKEEMPSLRNAWSHCTRFVAYEPGTIHRNFLPEREEGRFTFEARALASEIGRKYRLDSLNGEDSGLTEFHCWLKRADEFDDRTTPIPPEEDGWGILMGEMALKGLARVHCRLCRTMVDPAHLTERKRCRQLPFQSSEIRCAEGHLLLRPLLIRLVLPPPPGLREALMRLKETREPPSSSHA